ncbi:MAG: hypothetical protein WCE64_04150 [Bacteroidales bacterium]
MKIFFTSAVILIISSTLQAEGSDSGLISSMFQSSVQDSGYTATMKSASRLFRYRDDLSSVILIIPADSVVAVLGSEGVYLRVDYEGNEGYVYSSQAEINKAVPENAPVVSGNQAAVQENQASGQRMSRYSYLQNRYGRSVGSKIYEGKIWKGMTPQMVRDSWGSPGKINRVVRDNNITDEWIYGNTWLHFTNNLLTDWGPVRQ